MSSPTVSQKQERKVSWKITTKRVVCRRPKKKSRYSVFSYMNEWVWQVVLLREAPRLGRRRRIVLLARIHFLVCVSDCQSKRQGADNPHHQSYHPPSTMIFYGASSPSRMLCWNRMKKVENIIPKTLSSNHIYHRCCCCWSIQGLHGRNIKRFVRLIMVGHLLKVGRPHNIAW